jgi:DNA-binding SARP family transcriptional activator
VKAALTPAPRLRRARLANSTSRAALPELDDGSWGAEAEAPSRVAFRILGPLEVTRDGEVVTPRPYKVRLLLATLLSRANVVVPPETLILALWGNNPPRTAAQATRVYISQLRRMLAGAPGVAHPALVTLPAGYRLVVSADSLDSLEFRRRCDLARRLREEGNLEVAAAEYRTAIGLWRGRALADVRGCPHLEAAAVHLEEACIAAVERRIDLDLRLHRHHELVADLFSLVAEYPLHERLHARLMIALYRSGRTSDALAVYRQLRDVLVRELGVEPSRELQATHQAVLRSGSAPDMLENTDLWTL